jgi:hypothetical protein
MSQVRLNTRTNAGPAEVALIQGSAIIPLNHARLASVDSGLHAHFGGFFFSGVCA